MQRKRRESGARHSSRENPEAGDPRSATEFGIEPLPHGSPVRWCLVVATAGLTYKWYSRVRTRRLVVATAGKWYLSVRNCTRNLNSFFALQPPLSSLWGARTLMRALLSSLRLR